MRKQLAGERVPPKILFVGLVYLLLQFLVAFDELVEGKLPVVSLESLARPEVLLKFLEHVLKPSRVVGNFWHRCHFTNL